MRILKLITLSLFLVACCSSFALAVEDGNSRKGKYLFKKNCKTCHSDGAEGGEITPLSKTMSQWDRFFKKSKHSAEAWEKFSGQDLLDTNQFLFDHAVDSDQPETCG